jgi:hypothetical protein
MTHIKRSSLAMLLMVITSFSVYSQCKPFIKKQCMPTLAPYTNDGQLNNTVLRAGEGAELEVTMYQGQNYRLLVCAQEVLGNVNFKLMDLNYNVLFDSSKSKDAKKYWDFHVETTQQLIVQVAAPSQGKSEIVPSGCVAVIVGFKDAKN